MIRPGAFLVQFCGVACGATFVYSGMSHMLGPRRFRITVASHDLVPTRLQTPVVLLLPVVELALGVLLVGVVFRPSVLVWAFLPAAGLLSAFLVYTLILWRGPEGAECGCGGAGFVEPVTGWTCVRASILVLLAGSGIALGAWGDLPPGDAGLHAYSILAGSATALVVWLLPTALAPTSLLTSLSLGREGDA